MVSDDYRMVTELCLITIEVMSDDYCMVSVDYRMVSAAMTYVKI